MSRVTQGMLDQLLTAWTRAIGGREAKWYGDVGAYHFDNAYGQNRIVRVVNEGGGIDDVSPRLSKGELFNWMHAGIHTVWEYERVKEGRE